MPWPPRSSTPSILCARQWSTAGGASPARRCPPVQNVAMTPGLGIRVEVQGQDVRCGGPRLLEELGLSLPVVEDGAGATVLYLTVDSVLAG